MDHGVNTKNHVRVRFAPSPTGHLHIGGLRTALFNWLFARHHNGTFLVRIEDTDTQRSRIEYTQSILDALSWTGIMSDEQIIVQSQRFEYYTTQIQKLLHEQKAYKCYCTPEDLNERLKKNEPDNFFITYDGHCRTQKEEHDKPYAVRFAIPEDVQDIVYNDQIRNTVTFSRDQLDDFVIMRSDGTPLYNVVVVVDDAAMGITHIIRGDDHITNTPKQILLYQAFGFSIPTFAHVPMILGPSGDRLSKRDGAQSVMEYRQEGYLADALINYLVRLGWSHGDQEIFSRTELITFFSLDHVGKKGAIFDPQKLLWVNQQHMSTIDSSVLLQFLQKDVEPHCMDQLSGWSKEHIEWIITLYRERVHTLRQLLSELVLLHDGPKTYEEQIPIKGELLVYFSEIYALLDNELLFKGNAREQLSVAIKQLCKEHSIKFVQIAQPLRIALIGKNSGPGVFDLLTALGRVESQKRIERLCNYLK